VPFKELISQVNVVRNMTVIVILLASAFAFIITYLISSKITTPIKKLTRLMQKVEEGNLNVVASVERKDEIGALGRSFNSMISELKTLIEEVYKNQISRKEAELRALQAQINPHFLYNTLDVIYWTARIEGAPKTGEIVNALAKLFRLALNKGDEITTVEKEVEHLQSYLIIQKMRYTEEPEIIVQVAPSIYPCKTIKLILQPLVENALIHGIGELEEKGIIKVTGNIVGEDILFEIADNGVGMEAERIKEIFEGNTEEKKGYGIKNVDERIKLYFGDKYGIKIYSEIGKGTKVEVRISQNIRKLEMRTFD
jgi:two-component system sensor histidine kinase YesM